MESLGAGFVLATHDLEIRGAGELLGESQSGELTEVGMTLYLDMLERAVQALKEGHEPQLDRPLAAATEVELHVPAFLPDDYVPDVHLRLGLYKRIAAAADAAALDDLNAELVDRFGELPSAAQHLLRVARLKIRSRQLGLRRLDLGAQGGYVLFEEKNPLDPAVLIRLIQKHPREFRLEGSLKMRVTKDLAALDVRFDYAAKLLLAFKP
jgi:transcription-repair coupling factor (superfamily II helicase)